jgi:hypothetical protein
MLVPCLIESKARDSRQGRLHDALPPSNASIDPVAKRRTRAQDVAGSPLERHDGRCSDTGHQLRDSLVDAQPRSPLPHHRHPLAVAASSPPTPTRDRRSLTTAAGLPPAAPSPLTFPRLAHNATHRFLLTLRSPGGPARIFDGMSSQGGEVSKRQQQKEERQKCHQRGRAEKKSAQNGIKDDLPVDLPKQLPFYLLRSLYGPKSEMFVKDGGGLEVEGRQLETVPRSSAITDAAIPNPILVDGTFTPRFAAIRFTDGVAADVAAKLEQYVAACISVS